MEKKERIGFGEWKKCREFFKIFIQKRFKSFIATRSPDANIQRESPVYFSDTTPGRSRTRLCSPPGRNRRTRLARTPRWKLSVPLFARTKRRTFCETASWLFSTLERLSIVVGYLVGGRRRRRERRRLSVRIMPGFPKLGISFSRYCRGG